jgi:predicted metalloprotease with PDZ domain
VEKRTCGTIAAKCVTIETMRLSIIALAAAMSALGQAPVRLHVDATDAPRRLFHVRMTMPVNPGPVTLLYPQWIPGEHAPTGPITNLVGLKVQSGEQTIAWKRDDVNMFAFHIDVPTGVKSIDVTFDFISPPEGGGFTSTASATSELAVLNWNQLLLYPQGSQPDSLDYQADLRVPNGWRFGTALPIARESGNEIEFQPAPLTTLIDSPISTGKHYRTIELGSVNGIAHFMHVAADSDRALEAGPETIGEYKNLVEEAGALFGTQHYRDYHFLFTLSNHVAHFGLEHHESSDDREDERSLIDPDKLRATADLLPHEFVHSWNGKFRRPRGLVSDEHDGGYSTPMKGDLLWVYEGLTEYLGGVLAARSGLWKPEDYRDKLAYTAAQIDNQYGRRWRPLEDTAVSAPFLYDAGNDYADYRRGVDFYPEGILIWLDVDVTIRQLSKGAKSLDDFCRAFEGGPGGAPAMKPYDFEDVVAALDAVQPYDWAGFLKERLNSTSDHAPLGGIEHAGWKLKYNGEQSDFFETAEEGANLSYSIGLKVKDDGFISDISMAGPAAKAGISPATRIVAVNGRQFTATILREAIGTAVTDGKPIELLLRDGEYYKTYSVDYHGGERYPHLSRIENTPDLLADIVAAKVKK